MSYIVIISIVVLTLVHGFLVSYRKSGTLNSESTYDFYSAILYLTILINFSFLFYWWGIIITSAIAFSVHYFSRPFTYYTKKFELESEQLLVIFFTFSWINLIITILHFSSYLFI